MREFVIPVAVGTVIGFAWMVVWALVLRAFGIQTLTRTPEERATRKQRILQMGKLRYTLIFGVLGSGFGLGLGIATAIIHDSDDWRAAVICGTAGLLPACFNSVRAWNQLFRTEVMFPPVYPPLT